LSFEKGRWAPREQPYYHIQSLRRAVTWRRQAKPFSGPEEIGLKPRSAIGRTSSVRGCVKMIEAVAISLGLICAAIFAAHAIDAYLAH
jgi:hypothetical protein